MKNVPIRPTNPHPRNLSAIPMNFRTILAAIEAQKKTVKA